jgi:hypothetical protein
VAHLSTKKLSSSNYEEIYDRCVDYLHNSEDDEPFLIPEVRYLG